MNPEYITEIENVREVVLFGTADLEFWQTHLRAANQSPFDDHGKAQVLVSATNLKWSGIRFSELTISVAVDDSNFYLVQAFNSSAMLSWMERQFFQTPYIHRLINMQETPPAAIALMHKGTAIFNAKMSSKTSCLREQDQTWEGKIYLPSTKQTAPSFFAAKLKGHAQVYSFTSLDKFEITPGKNDTALPMLVDSGFTCHEWRIGNNSVHARSKTMPRH